MGIIDLHTHTLFSDGRESVEELIRMARERNIEILSITDHDSIYAYETLDAGLIKIINGIELSAWYNNKIIHILGYGMVLNNDELLNYCDKIYETSCRRTQEYLNILEKYNVQIPNTVLEDHMNNRYPLQYERLFSLLDQFKIHYNRSQLENNFLLINKNIKMPYLDLNRALNLIKDANGVAILAHPYKYQWDNINYHLYHLTQQGIDGIECYHSDAPISFSNYLVNYCNENHLLISGGSDAHKYYKNDGTKRNLGYGTMNNLYITKNDISSELLEYAEYHTKDSGISLF